MHLPIHHPDSDLSHDAVLGAFPEEFLKLTPVEQRLSLGLYRLLAEGEPVPKERLAEVLHLPAGVVAEILHGWPGVHYDPEARVIGYWGLALPETTHRFEVDGRALYTWCAWDSLFLPALLGKRAHVTSRCPVTGADVVFTVAPDRIEHAEPASVMVSMVAPEEGEIRQNMVHSFCHYVFFLSSAEAGAQWVAEHPGTFLISPQDAFALGSRKNRAQYAELGE